CLRPNGFRIVLSRGFLQKGAYLGDARQSVSPASPAHFVAEVADGFVIGSLERHAKSLPVPPPAFDVAGNQRAKFRLDLGIDHQATPARMLLDCLYQLSELDGLSHERRATGLGR